MSPIFLIGFMGCGKTTLGRALEQKEGIQYIDLDQYIERRFHSNIRDIFTAKGEEAFRDMERRMLREVGEFEDVVIACGGGTPCFFDNMDYMLSRGTVVWLDAGFDRNYSRLLMGRYKRPAISKLSDEELAEYVRRSFETRNPIYSRANIRFNSDHLDNAEEIDLSVKEFLDTIKDISAKTL